MNRVVLLDKCNGVSTGYMTILPENFQVRVGCYDDKKTVDILFLETSSPSKQSILITDMPSYWQDWETRKELNSMKE